MKNTTTPIPIHEFKGELFLDLEKLPSIVKEYKSVEFEKPLRIVGIRFAEEGKVFDFDAGTFILTRDSQVVIESEEKGLMLGWVSKQPFTIENKDLNLELAPLVRIATSEDLEKQKRALTAGQEAIIRSQSTVEKYKLPMTIFRVDYTLDLRKAIVYFTSPDRVDFRDLLRELVHLLRAKVELRQVGDRDQAKMVGGVGPCGQELCCSRFIDKFHNVTIKMAKDQELSLKPTKVTGMCGRLKCCLAYEEQAYVDARKKVPRKGKCVKCKASGACGIVKDVNLLKLLVTVELDEGGIQVFPASELIEERTLKGESQNSGDFLVAQSDDPSDESDKEDLSYLRDDEK